MTDAERLINKYLEGKDEPGKRDGTGPHKGSFQRKVLKKKDGKRKERGEKCPAGEDDE